MAKTYRLDLFVKPTSVATEAEVFRFALDWANDRTNADANKDENGDPINAYYCDVTDFKRGGKKYMVFGDLARAMLDLEQKHDIIDPATIWESLTEVNTEFSDHEARITTLEESRGDVEATIV